MLLGAASAASTDSKGSCSRVEIMLLGANRVFTVWNNQDDHTGAANTCLTGTPKIPAEIDISQEISLHCLETTGGATPPGAPDTNGIIIRGYEDNNGFPDGVVAADIIWTQTFTSCLTQQDFTKYCTQTGASGANPFFGTVRLYIRAVKTGGLPPNYDDSSDSNDNVGFFGAYHCNPHADTFLDNLGTTGSSPTIYVGNDVFRAKFNISQGVPYNTGNIAKIEFTCGLSAVQTVSAGFVPVATLTNFDSTLSQVNNTLIDGCRLFQNVTINRNSAITGWTTTPYVIWIQTNPCTGCSFPAVNTVMRDTGKLRTIFYAGFEMSNLDDKVTPPVLNLTIFTIGSDSQFYKILNLQNARNELQQSITGSCDKKDPNFSLISTTSIGSSDAGGDYASQSSSVIAPSGMWSFNCTFTSSPNVGFYNFSFTYTSPFTANTGISISWNVTENGSLFDANVSMTLRIYDPITDAPALAIPSSDVRLTVFSFNRLTEQYDIRTVDRQIMHQLDGISSDWFYNFTTNETALTGAMAYAQFNLTGNPFLGSQGYHLNWTIPGSGGTQVFDGNFSGNFTGNVTDLGVIPITIAYPVLLAGMFALSLVIAFAIRNPIPAFAGGIVNLVCLIIVTKNVVTMTDDLKNLFYLVFAAGLIICFFRAFGNLNRAGENS